MPAEKASITISKLSLKFLSDFNFQLFRKRIVGVKRGCADGAAAARKMGVRPARNAQIEACGKLLIVCRFNSSMRRIDAFYAVKTAVLHTFYKPYKLFPLHIYAPGVRNRRKTAASLYNFNRFLRGGTADIGKRGLAPSKIFEEKSPTATDSSPFYAPHAQRALRAAEIADLHVRSKLLHRLI